MPSTRTRAWFDPREGLARLTRLDALLIAAFVTVAFAIAVVNYGWPRERYFDEIYFARSAEDYLRGIPQFEWTHPPFTKLVITLSMLLFGGLHGLGNTGYGWRFLNVAVGALEVGVVYAFAKRLTASTLYAAVAALFLTFDGFHFVEQRIATGEITIATLITIVLYALYRYWIAAQVRVTPIAAARFGVPFAATLAAGIPVAGLFAWLANAQPRQHDTQVANGIWPSTPGALSYGVAFVYAMLAVYLIARIVVPRVLRAGGTRATYAEGTVVEVRADRAGAGTVEYVTPVAKAVFAPAGTMTVGGDVIEARHATRWLALMLVALGLLLASKWNGFFDLAIVWAVVVLVWGQRFVGGRPLYGNPNGWPVDVVLGLTLFAGATAYILSYVPTLLLGHGHTLADIIGLQQQMYWYHSQGVTDHTHPYRSVWWQWPLMQIPIAYWYQDFRTGAAAASSTACCVGEIIAIPNPLVFLLGLISVPYTAWLAWRERNKGYALLAIAYLVQWLPWVHSPRELWEYHFFPNLVVIVLCDAILVQRVMRRFAPGEARWWLGGYCAAVAAVFWFFYPVLAGVPIAYDRWYARMLPDAWHLGFSWILPHGH